jgi:hypothetical protein
MITFYLLVYEKLNFWREIKDSCKYSQDDRFRKSLFKKNGRLYSSFKRSFFFMLELEKNKKALFELLQKKTIVDIFYTKYFIVL